MKEASLLARLREVVAAPSDASSCRTWARTGITSEIMIAYFTNDRTIRPVAFSHYCHDYYLTVFMDYAENEKALSLTFEDRG